MLHKLNRQTVVGWAVGLLAGAAMHFAVGVWWIELLLVLAIRMTMDLLYAWHDSVRPPREEDKTVA